MMQTKIVPLLCWSCGVISLLTGLIILTPPMMALAYMVLSIAYGWWGHKLLCEN